MGNRRSKSQCPRERDLEFLHGYLSRHFEELKLSNKRQVRRMSYLQEKVDKLSELLISLDNSVQSIGYMTDNVATNIQILLNQAQHKGKRQMEKQALESAPNSETKEAIYLEPRVGLDNK